LRTDYVGLVLKSSVKFIVGHTLSRVEQSLPIGFKICTLGGKSSILPGAHCVLYTTTEPDDSFMSFQGKCRFTQISTCNLRTVLSLMYLGQGTHQRWGMSNYDVSKHSN